MPGFLTLPRGLPPVTGRGSCCWPSVCSPRSARTGGWKPLLGRDWPRTDGVWWWPGMELSARHLEGLGAELGLGDSLVFVGAVSSVEEWLRRASMLLATSPIDSFGMTVIEAMRAGLPVVATAAGGHLETVGLMGRSMLFAPGDTGQAAGHLIALSESEDLRQSLADEGEQVRRTHFSVSRQHALTDALYRQLL